MTYIPTRRRGKNTVRFSSVILLGMDFQEEIPFADRRLIPKIERDGIFDLNETTNEIELELVRKGNRFTFVIDSEDVTMCEARSDTDQNFSLSDFFGVKALCAQMKVFIAQPSESH